MAKSRSGGGINSNKLVRLGVRTGIAAQGKRHQAVAQIGSNLGNHSTGDGKIHRRAVERVEGPRPISVELGNKIATNVGKGGCGTGRVLYGQSGTQGTHGPTNPGRSTPTRDILNDFGPDSASVRGRR